jgi:hypothetical protein
MEGQNPDSTNNTPAVDESIIESIDISKEDPQVTLECIKEKSKLRVRITSGKYLRNANCQFPRNIRLAGRKYEVPASGIKMVSGPRGTYFYRIDPKLVKIVDVPKTPVKVFGDDEDPICIICMDAPKTKVFVPCGHYACCDECVNSLKNKCPLCRTDFLSAVDRALIQ